MRKIIAIVGLFVIVSLLLSACAQKRATTTEKPKGTTTQDVTPDVEPKVSGTAPEALSDEELEQLKADIESLKFEDLGGLAEE